MIKAKCSIRKVVLYPILIGLFFMKVENFHRKNSPIKEESLVARNTKGLGAPSY